VGYVGPSVIKFTQAAVANARTTSPIGIVAAVETKEVKLVALRRAEDG
jgi:hypothetical protein